MLLFLLVLLLSTVAHGIAIIYPTGAYAFYNGRSVTYRFTGVVAGTQYKVTISTITGTPVIVASSIITAPVSGVFDGAIMVPLDFNDVGATLTVTKLTDSSTTASFTMNRFTSNILIANPLANAGLQADNVLSVQVEQVSSTPPGSLPMTYHFPVGAHLDIVVPLNFDFNRSCYIGSYDLLLQNTTSYSDTNTRLTWTFNSTPQYRYFNTITKPQVQTLYIPSSLK